MRPSVNAALSYGGSPRALRWWKRAGGLGPGPSSDRPFTVSRAEGRTIPTHRCLVPASEFRLRSRGRAYRVSLADGDWFYFAGIWRPAKPDWPEAYAILTV